MDDATTRSERGADRRSFLRALAGAIGLTATAPSLARAADLLAGSVAPRSRADSIPAVGLHLSLVQAEMRKDFARTLRRLAQMGYQEVEFPSYFGKRPEEVRAALAQAGLRAPSAYIEGGLLTVLRDWERALDRARTVGHQWLVLPTIDSGLRGSPDNWLRLADTLNKAGERAKPYGIRVAYHNHEFEFVRQRGKLPYDMLLERTDRSLVFFELDLYAMIRSGERPTDYFARWPGRFPMVHVTDMPEPPKLAPPSVGGGILDLQSIFARRRRAGTEHFFVAVELDPLPAEIAPMQFAFTSAQYLAKLTF